ASQFFGTRDVRDIRKIHIIEYQNHLVSIPVGSKTIWNYLSLFKTFLNWCKNDLGILSLVPPFPSVEQQEEPQINWVSAEDQIKLLSHARVEDRPLLIFLMLSGTRPCEARALKVSDVDLDKGLIYVRASFSGTVYRQKRKGKGAKGYAIPIHTEILPYIQQRLKSALPGAWLFPSPRHGGPFSYQRLAKAWNLIRQRAGITYRLRLYDATRHSLASGLLAKGESLFTVSKLLGHQDMKTTMRYAHPDLESLRKSISKVSLLKESEPEQVAKKKEIKG
ncbi:MAG: site-specific integrase, partial [Deltaproteobacteria bacterium]|nr:site-specific integrase [Deltaproteobacteria bacterium]